MIIRPIVIWHLFCFTDACNTRPEKGHPVLLRWNSDASHITSPQEDSTTNQEDSITNQQILVDIEVPTATSSSDEGTRMSKMEKKPPTTKSEDFLW
jgi:hypothetical protein